MEGPILTDGDCSHEIKTLVPWKNNDKPRQYIKKQRHRFADKGTKVCIVEAMVFPVVMCGCESWTIKTTEH